MQDGHQAQVAFVAADLCDKFPPVFTPQPLLLFVCTASTNEMMSYALPLSPLHSPHSIVRDRRLLSHTIMSSFKDHPVN